MAFACVVLVYAGIGGVAVYNGLQERASLNRQEANANYERGVAYVQNGEYELAIAEFEHALRLDPSHREARDALRDAKTTAVAQPTPTSATLNEALASILAEAETLVTDGNWADAVSRLSQLRDLDNGFQRDRVSDLLFEASMNLGRQRVTAGQVEQGVLAFQQALNERPGDAEANGQLELASLYTSAKAAWGTQWEDTIDYLEKLYALDAGYLDVLDLTYQAHVGYGDAAAGEGSWCLAQKEYDLAAELRPGDAIEAKRIAAGEQCQVAASSPPGAAAATATPAVSIGITSTGTISPTDEMTPTEEISSTNETAANVADGGASLLFSRFDTEMRRWEIVSVDLSTGAARPVLADALQPALSPDGRLLAYVPATGLEEGIHVLDLATGDDLWTTTFAEDVLPSWAPDNVQLVFPSVRSADRRWQVFIDWATAEEGESVPLLDGRTPAWSPDGGRIAFQGSDEQGNNPGIYVVGPEGGPVTRVTDGESDRYPAWSPDCMGGEECRLAFMSNRMGSWQIYTVDATGSEPTLFTTSEGNSGLPAWSPDGASIAFVSDRDGSWGVYVAPTSGGAAAKVANWGHEHEDWLMERVTWAR